jgi:hypothetical protein
VAVAGFWFPPARGQQPLAPPLFQQYYSAETRAMLPIMCLDRLEPIVELFEGAGFRAVDAVDVSGLASEDVAGVLLYILVAVK